MMKLEFPTLTADDIEVRVAQVRQNGLSLLLYKNARCDMRLLDSQGLTWQREHQVINGNLFCTVSIYDEDLQAWVSRQDVGTPSFAEPVKGEASDSFKRACTNWGIGRELYTAPFIWVSADKANIKAKGNGYTCNDRFKVTQIIYDDKRNITALAIKNVTKKTMAFVWDGRKAEKVA